MPRAKIDNPFLIARKYWEELPVEKRRYEELALALGDTKTEAADKTRQNELGRLIKQWELRGLVRHQVLPELSSLSNRPGVFLPRDSVLEEELRARFGLRGTIVAIASSIRPPYDYEKNAQGYEQSELELHTQLGRWAGRVLTALLRKDDTLGVGGGRGPFFTVNHSHPSGNQSTAEGQFSFRKAKSLTGNMLAHILPSELDADKIARIAHARLNGSEPPECVNHSVVKSENSRNVSVDDVTIACFGCGALAGGHRLKAHRDSPELQAVRDELEELNELVERVDPKVRGKGPFSHCVADITNHLFVIEPEILGIGKLNSKEEAALNKITDLVNKLNERFINVHPKKDLSTICERGACICVGGGPHKVAAIHQILVNSRREKPWITHLITDDLVALEIINRERSPSAKSSSAPSSAANMRSHATRKSRG